ncbi:glucose-6-phosphate isomerase family protein [uncultured Sphaerochaeta sp.]|jgi:glucose-6-phosphate isomerase|uniref:glucose-6-phosphate isomerase family protein n=1 Tax=Sphaerochaeta sp. TaxID=1972642 RepID=UPI002A0A9F13|nr:glucose-6-phosphate isomerase family protein [uncultured Sphaerochaeta sp.]
MQSSKTKFNLKNGLAKSEGVESLKRYATNLKGIFADEEKLTSLIDSSNPLIYEFYDLGVEEKPGNLAYGTSIVYPGVVGREFYMTKGHFHTVLDTAEVYLCLSGHGLMVMENPEGETEIQELTAGEAVLVPGRYAHRSVNISDSEPLVTFFTFAADAGHDYGTIEQKGFRKLVLRTGNETYEVVDNPNWKAN